jgi:hypothetical protein
MKERMPFWCSSVELQQKTRLYLCHRYRMVRVSLWPLRSLVGAPERAAGMGRLAVRGDGKCCRRPDG